MVKLSHVTLSLKFVSHLHAPLISILTSEKEFLVFSDRISSYSSTFNSCNPSQLRMAQDSSHWIIPQSQSLFSNP
ncbi:unnamed protein product [Arabidopsis lyrata]|nr:unnamed protein product [Arabidopsis lyrata]